MNKYITLAALLAAGTACAHAAEATWDTDGFYLDGVKVVANGDFSLVVAFDGTDVGATSAEDLFKIGSEKDSVALAFDGNAYSNNSAKVDYMLTIGETVHTKTSGGHYSMARMNGTIQQNTFRFDFTTEEGIISGLNVVINFSNGNGPETDVYTGLASLNLGSDIEWDSLSVNEGISNFSVKLVSDNLVAVPEPSAFGMLAGLGALALVAARRRRR
ncbi:MAG: PEP-CTERM sorting domain-containing protein [Opitutales bacterium]|nr:PEP-CTERM sorting domain-containing protein [Opitutales bacterium]